VLCPGAVKTNFNDSARNRPSWAGPALAGDAEEATAERFVAATTLGVTPADVAGLVADGIRSRRFYILTSDNRNEAILRRAREIIDGTPPQAPVPFL
jgi:hypothetical protein